MKVLKGEVCVICATQRCHTHIHVRWLNYCSIISSFVLQQVLNAPNQMFVSPLFQHTNTLHLSRYSIHRICRMTNEASLLYVLVAFPVFMSLEPQELCFAACIPSRAISCFCCNGSMTESDCFELIKGYVALNRLKMISLKFNPKKKWFFLHSPQKKFSVLVLKSF